MKILTQYKREELTYSPKREVEDDNWYYFHDFVDDHGSIIIDADFPSKECASEKMIKLWFNLGCPSREDLNLGRPIRFEDLTEFSCKDDDEVDHSSIIANIFG